MARATVAVLRTRPETVLDDYSRLMRLANYRAHLPKDKDTALKINISWQTWYPACSSAPWQIEGVARALQNAGYTDLVGVHNDTVVQRLEQGHTGRRLPAARTCRGGAGRNFPE